MGSASRVPLVLLKANAELAEEDYFFEEGTGFVFASGFEEAGALGFISEGVVGWERDRTRSTRAKGSRRELGCSGAGVSSAVARSEER